MRYILSLLLLITCHQASSAASFGSPSADGTSTQLIDSTISSFDTYWIAPAPGAAPWFVTYTGTGAPTGAVTTTVGTGLQLSAGVLSCTVTGGVGTVTSVAAGTGLTGGTITGAGTISMPAVGTAGSYSGVTTDAQGRVTAGISRLYDNNVSHSLNSNFTANATRDIQATYSINVAWTLQALLSGTASAFLEYSTNGGSSWVTVSQTSKTIGLLTFSGNDDMNLSGGLPANSLVRIRTTSTNMTVSYVRGQEVWQ